MQRSGYINIGNEKLHYLQSGTGKKVLLAFHGYSNNASIFYSFERHLAHQYTILSFDLPHHGKSKWPEDVPLTQKDLLTLVKEIKELFSVDKVSLMGYSMGGRVCLTIIALTPESIDKVVLIATDGLSINFYYYFVTRTFIGKKLFRHMMNKPGSYLKILNWLKNIKLLHDSRHRFVAQYIDSEANRLFLLRVWQGMSRLIVSPARIKNAISKYNIPVTIFMGEYDRILPPILAEKFKVGMKTVHVHILKKGHRTFDSTNAGEIARHLL